jgi:acetyl esterase/lipase
MFDEFADAQKANPGMSIDETRVLFGRIATLTGEPSGVDYSDVIVEGIRCLWATPQGCAQNRVLLALHGGGFIVGDRFSHRKLYAQVAKAVGIRALIVDYGRAPEHTFPSAVLECTEVYKWLLSQRIASSHIAVIGDSAGANLSMSTILSVRNSMLPLPAAVVALSPWYDLEASGETFVTNAEFDRLVTRESSLNLAQLYLAGCSPKDPLANPLFADLSGFPPTYIQSGSHEVLLDDARCAERLMVKVGVDCRLDIFPEMQHVFHLMAGNSPEADEALTRIADWLRPRLGLESGEIRG